MGYFTKWGDGASDFNPIADLTATEVFAFLRWLNAPAHIVEKAPSAGLFEGQTDEAEYSCSGVGSINAVDMKARKTEASVSGVGGIDCYASEYINGRVTGVGGLKYAGHPKKKDLHHTMTGGISEL